VASVTRLCSVHTRAATIGPDSDIDILIEINPEAHIGIWGYVGLKEYIAALFDGPVDVVDQEALKSHVASAATADTLYAF
jgi:predicted nucleotidyltransferase